MNLFVPKNGKLISAEKADFLFTNSGPYSIMKDNPDGYKREKG